VLVPWSTTLTVWEVGGLPLESTIPDAAPPAIIE
jgi:hypothetical protein